MRSDYKIMIVAGEASGDAHAAKLVRALRAASSDSQFTFFGAGSHALRAAGMETIVKADNMAVVGLPEIAKALPMFLKAFRDLKNAAVERRPDAAILVDFPDFNLKLARSLKKRGVKVIYYISPQLWAWRKYRLRTIQKYVDLLITILPFEKDWYARHGVRHVEFVGNPLTREVHSNSSREEFCHRHGLDQKKPIVSLLPGSRQKEVARILPIMLDAVVAMSARDPSIQFVVALASVRSEREVRIAIESVNPANYNATFFDKILIVKEETYDALAPPMPPRWPVELQRSKPAL